MATYDDNISHDAYPETALANTGYEHEGYEEGEYYQDDGMGGAGEQDDRVSTFYIISKQRIFIVFIFTSLDRTRGKLILARIESNHVSIL